MSLFTDPEGRPISLYEWAALIETDDRHIGDDELPSGYWVSTVYIGLHPNVFETMVFEMDSERSVDEARYLDRWEAQLGHENMVAKWQAKVRES